ncbi:ATP-dependent DNA helicase PIF1-like [Lactuca sativa]|uniref:ATP-dependent DNA helicase PIF1-like n=1 Tax=Lactuca sativa TaxID=4236 RepID=UPI000CD8CB8B|nr:ATP-dependent DNA helicase PIF1-like [Lactuca sativa]
MVRLPFYLPNQRQIVYGKDDDIDDVLDKPSVAASKFTLWMECNAIDTEVRELTYVEFPIKFVWILNGRFWKRRKLGKPICRIHLVSPSLGEAYFLRILLNKVKGPTSFDEIRTWSFGKIHENIWRMEFYITNDKGADLSLGGDELKNLTLFEKEQILLRNNSTLKKFTKMPYLDVESVSSSNNRLISEELDYDILVIKNDFDHMFLALTDEQRKILLNIMSVVKENRGGVFFVYGYSGMGKTFLWKTISAAIRYDGNIVLNVASSGIASLLLPGGRTTHSRFILPFELIEDFVCKINPDGELVSLLRKTSLIIWDEAPMVHKHVFEALDRTLKDVLRCGNSSISNIPFGGKVIVFGGDFRQFLPVVPGGSRQNIVNAFLSSSYLWDQSDTEKIRDFANWLLDIGEGKLGGPNDDETIIDIPDDILINDPDDPIGDEVEYLSSDSICESEFVHDQFDANVYSPDVLNGLKVSGLPNHKLVLKIGVPVILMRNIDQKNGLYNDIRLQVISLGKHVIETRIISGTNIGNQTFIPRMSLTPLEEKNSLQIQKKTVSFGCMFCDDY